jgi:putative PIN family toxin of toxin-antitoxin system
VSEATVVELKEVFRRSKFNKYVTEELRLAFLAALVQQAEQVKVTEVITVCHEAKDNKFLELAVSGRSS